jgi:hypothetical protein
VVDLKRTHSLHALFATLVAGCGPTIDVGQDDGSTQSDTSPTSGATATTATTATTDATTTVTGSTDSYDGYDYDGYDYDGGCWDEPYHVDVEIWRSEIARWLDERGQVSTDRCWQACSTAFPVEWTGLDSCTVHYDSVDTDDGTPPPDSTTGGTTGDTTGDTTGTTGEKDTEEEGTTDGQDDELVRLECEGYIIECGVGRAHEALQSEPLLDGADPVGRWAAAAAHSEAASVAAFMAVRHELVAHGAPEELAARALDAAVDEVMHARMMAGIAVRHGEIPTRPQFRPIELRELEAFAIENAVEGCVRETWSALEATHQASAATDPEVRTAMRRIAEDETRHAELAHDIDAWLHTRLAPAARRRVHRAREEAVAELMQALDRRGRSSLETRAGLPSHHSARRLARGLRDSLWS